MASRHRRVRRLGSGRLRPQPRRSVIVNKEIKFYSAGQLLAQGADGLLVFEAENFDANQGDVWIVDSARGTPSGGASVVVPVGADNDMTRIEYNLTFTQTGTNIVWFRGTGNSGGDDSGWLLIDGARPPERGATARRWPRARWPR